MSNQEYNLDEDGEGFYFVLGGHKYMMRYPSTEDSLNAKKLKTKEEQSDWMYHFIKPVAEDAPPIAEAMNKANLRAVAKFNQMIEKEFTHGTL